MSVFIMKAQLGGTGYLLPVFHYKARDPNIIKCFSDVLHYQVNYTSSLGTQVSRALIFHSISVNKRISASS